MNEKQRVAEFAAQLIKDDMLVGLGTGSTANYFIEALSVRCLQQGLKIQLVSSSVVSAIKAQSLGLNVLGIDTINAIDVYVDGADEVCPDKTLLKGRGADLVREKILAKASSQFWVLIDPSKRVESIGQNFAIPVEVMPFAWRMVQASLTKIGGEATLRTQGDGLAVTSYGSLVLDVKFNSAYSNHTLNQLLSDIPGVIEHGIFYDLATVIYCGQDQTVIAL